MFGKKLITCNSCRWNQKSSDFLQIGSESTPWRTYWHSWRRRWQYHTTVSWSSLLRVPASSFRGHKDNGAYCFCNMQYVVYNPVLVSGECPKKVSPVTFSWLHWHFVCLISWNCIKGCCLINGIYQCVKYLKTPIKQ